MTYRRASPISALRGLAGAGRTAVLATVETSAPTAENTGRPTALTSVMTPRTLSAPLCRGRTHRGWLVGRTRPHRARPTRAAQHGNRISVAAGVSSRHRG